MSGLRVEGVVKRFGSTVVLDRVGLDVPERTITAVLGPSGCGKTTLLRLVAGFTRLDDGTIGIGGETVAGPGRHLPAQRRRVGYVAQEGALFPHRSVADNVTFGLPRRDRRDARRVQELLELVGLDPAYRERFPHELSGGQQQRVALARALAPRPSLVLLDEPFASLDAQLRVSTGRAVVDALRASDATGVLVTHDQSEAMSLADRVAVMRAGRIVQEGTPAEVYRHPVDRDVAAFVGGALLLPATVRDGQAACVLGEVAVDPVTPPGPITLLLRPEQLRLHGGDGAGARGGDGTRGTAGVPATVRELEFFGHDADVHLQLDHHTEAEIRARVLGTGAPRVGERLTVSVEGRGVAFDLRHRALSP